MSHKSICSATPKRVLASQSLFFPPVHFGCHVACISTQTSPYEYIDDVERLDQYRRGGYHPIRIGDIFKDRYCVVHKLGYGSSSTIWLAWDGSNNQHVAVKVGTADCDIKEASILTQLAVSTEGKVDFGRNLIPTVLDQFTIEGPNGAHHCLVTPPATCSLVDAIKAADGDPFKLNVARSICAQFALAVAYIHNAGYAHGDLHMGNILLRTLDIEHLTTQQLYDKFGAPEADMVVRVDRGPIESQRVPPKVFSPIWFNATSDAINITDAKVLLADYGTAFRPDFDSRYDSYTPLQIRPPEARFENSKPLSFASDIWSLGCVIWAILGVRPFLDIWIVGTDGTTADQVDALGPLPTKWWDAWEKRAQYFANNGQAKEGREVWTFESRFEISIQEPRRRRGQEVMSDAERDALFKLIKSVLVFDPSARLNANQILETEWMRTWAIPEARRTWEGNIVSQR